MLTFMFARLPVVLIVTLFIFFIGYRFTPDNYDGVGDMASTKGAGKDDKKLSPAKEKLTYVIFTASIVAMIISNYVKFLTAAQCASIGALLVVFTGILSEKEAIRAINLKVIAIYAGTIALAAGITSSGANQVISDFMQNALGGMTSPRLIAFIVMIATCACTQFMNNTSTLNVFRVLAAVVSVACGFDPRAIMIAAEMGATCSVLLPTASATQAMVFAQGGYTVKEYLKAGFPVFALYVVLYMLWVPTIFPAI